MILQKVIHRFKKMKTSVEVGLLKSIAHKHNYDVKPKLPVKISETVIENYFKTNHEKNALLSYIIYPFIDEISNSHSNNRECFFIAQILNELGYNVDIINWDNITFIPIKNYNLVIDNHNNLERLCFYFSKNVIKIFHATNAHWLYQNRIELDRHYEYYLKTGIAIRPTRMLQPGNSAAYCDAISMLGNSFTKMTFGKYVNKVCRIPISVTTTFDEIESGEIHERKNNFLWFNSAGFLLKGLDIVLDAFINLPNCNLYVCGNFDREKNFINTYAGKLKACTNIKMIGWVDVDSKSFLEITAKCLWIVNTSFSEGGGGSTINCMAKGLIPIATRSASIDIVDNETGFHLTQNSAEGLTHLIHDLIKLPEDRLRKCAVNAREYTHTFHTIENFKSSYKSFLKSLILT